MQKINPCLWFNDNAEEAAAFYTSVFKNSKIARVSRYGEAGAKVTGRPVGSVMMVEFTLSGQTFCAINGGTDVPFNWGVSLMVNCDTQAELDAMWEKLSSEGGEKSHCGWVQDKFGLSWQIIPANLGELLGDDAEQTARVHAAVMEMDKLDIRQLEAAAAGN